MLPLPKAHTSALCLVPPASSWRSIQALRVFNDKGFARWMPHVNLLYPFHADDGGPAFAACAGQARAALQDVQPFKVRVWVYMYMCYGWEGDAAELSSQGRARAWPAVL